MKFLKEAHITYRSLQYIKNEDLKEIIPLVGLRLEFREKLFTWRKKEFGIYDETLSVPSKVQDWLYDSQQQSPSSLGSPLDKNYSTLYQNAYHFKLSMLNFKIRIIIFNLKMGIKIIRSYYMEIIDDNQSKLIK
ncbi:hypothetical protein FF38_01272 [Lucilia cuprina]|uniref:Uncharacterized protein n=1 Tax=Lucilia cuprina TaxID=7375 RepID=A0A0L0CJK7_LUCCU|nr:hypothetical protein FF38_01272 [Lucilia cuprina]